MSKHLTDFFCINTRLITGGNYTWLTVSYNIREKVWSVFLSKQYIMDYFNDQIRASEARL